MLLGMPICGGPESSNAQQLICRTSLRMTGQCGMQERPELFQQLLHKTAGQRADWEYPFAVAGINLTFMLQEVVDLRDRRVGTLVTNRLPASAPGQAFLALLQQAQDAFEQVGSQSSHRCFMQRPHSQSACSDSQRVPDACALTAQRSTSIPIRQGGGKCVELAAAARPLLATGA